MIKKSFLVKSFAVALGALLYTACTQYDNPADFDEPEPGPDPVLSEIVPVDLTSKVGTSQAAWNAAGVCATQFAPAITTADGRTAQMMENYQTNVDATGVLMSQTIEGLENGKYAVELYANAFFTSGRGFDSAMEDGATDVAYVFANDEKAFLTCNIATETQQNGEYALEVEVTDGTLTLGLGKEQAGTNWHTIQIKSLTFQKTLGEAYEQLLPEADEVLAKKMSADVKAALEAAIAAPKSLESFAALEQAIAAAKNNAAAYESAAPILAAMKELVDGTNVYTDAALAEYYTNYVEKYENGTLTAEDGNALQDPSIVTAWHAAITCDNFLLSAWDTNPDFVDAPYYINTWSVEGDNDGTGFHVPFFEYWTGDGESLGERTLTATINGLSAGNYEVSAWVRVRAKNGFEAPAYGVSLQANEGRPISVTGGEVVNSQFFIGNFTAEGSVSPSGTLTIKFIVAADNNISWLAFKNVKFTKK